MRVEDLGACGREGCCGNDWIYRDYNVDTSAFENFQRENKDIWDLLDNATELDDDEKVLLPHRAFGFVLRSRKWATFAIELLSNVTYNDGWSNLELPPGHKETVLALVQNHAGGPNSSPPRTETFETMDLIRGKGKGLIILLHGEPGVGKTSTAECVADHTRRPLFPITCGDIGDNAEKVEDNLENNFQLAHRWGCVLLLDEAEYVNS
jgi:ATPase family associated with various cellular activities (AAA)